MWIASAKATNNVGIILRSESIWENICREDWNPWQLRQNSQIINTTNMFSPAHLEWLLSLPLTLCGLFLYPAMQCAMSDKVSYPQQSAAAITGVVFMKYSMDVLPKNWNLFSVNMFLAATAAFQLARKINADYGEVCSRGKGWAGLECFPRNDLSY